MLRPFRTEIRYTACILDFMFPRKIISNVSCYMLQLSICNAWFTKKLLAKGEVAKGLLAKAVLANGVLANGVLAYGVMIMGVVAKRTA